MTRCKSEAGGKPDHKSAGHEFWRRKQPLIRWGDADARKIPGPRELDSPWSAVAYIYRIYDRYHRRVVSLAVLCDRPSDLATGLRLHFVGCEVGIRFPIIGPIDYRRDEAAREQSATASAAVILASERSRDAAVRATRWQWKLRLAKGLYDRGLKRDHVRQLMRILDWMLSMPVGDGASFRR